LLNYLAENCQEIYKLKEWDSIHSKVEKYEKKKEIIEQSNSSTKEEELTKAKSEVVKEINEGIKVSIGAGVPGIGEFHATVEYNTQEKY